MKLHPTIAAIVLTAAAGGCAAPGGSAVGESYALTVAAGGFARENTPVSFELPAGAVGRQYCLRGPGGEAVPLQVDGDGRAHFILAELAAGTVAQFTLEPGAVPGPRSECGGGTER
jgi:hypothetical protein